MRIGKLAAPVVAVTLAFGVVAAGPAAAINNIKPFGTQEKLQGFGSGEIGYTVDGLAPSSDPIPYPVAGALYEATVTVEALQGWVVPVIPYFNARAESGQNYQVIMVDTPGGLSGAAVAPGEQATGKLYFDVVGDTPNSVVVNNGTEDLLAWVG